MPPNQPNRVFVAKRRVYWSDDAGASWNQTEAVAGPAIEVLAIARAADSTVAVARGTNAFVTHNLSEWTPYSGLPGLPVLDIVFNDTNANYMWLAFGGYAEADRVWRHLRMEALIGAHRVKAYLHCPSMPSCATTLQETFTPARMPAST